MRWQFRNNRGMRFLGGVGLEQDPLVLHPYHKPHIGEGILGAEILGEVGLTIHLGQKRLEQYRTSLFMLVTSMTVS